MRLFGEDKAFNLLRAMHKSTNNYPRTGIGAIKPAARGETGIGVTFLDDASPDIAAGFSVSVVAPCEGTGYQVASMSLVKNARNADAARKFYDWALTLASQKLAADTKNYQTMSNRSTPTPALAVKIADVKLINYGFGKYGDAPNASVCSPSGTKRSTPRRSPVPLHRHRLSPLPSAHAEHIAPCGAAGRWRLRRFCRFCGTLRCVRHRRRTQHTVAHLQSQYQ